MAAGSVSNVLLCVPVTSSGDVTSLDQQICPEANGQAYQVQVQQAYVLSPGSAGYLDSIAQPFDYVAAAGFWGVAFTTVVSLWLVAVGAGAIMNFVRRA